MTVFATMPREEQSAFVGEAAARLNVSAVIVEKDFWVCWMLRHLFLTPELAPYLVFKGGTSLSKVYGVIYRFSEDIDLSVAPTLLGWREADLDDAPSASQRQKRFRDLENACCRRVESVFLDTLEARVVLELGPGPSGQRWLTYQMDPVSNSPTLLFAYPSALPPLSGYIPPMVKMEFGSLTDQRPTGRHALQPMLAEAIPGAGEDGRAEVVALEVERTFWEKATILHAEYHRPPGQPMRDRCSRHYADMAALLRHSAKTVALARLDLLARVG